MEKVSLKKELTLLRSAIAGLVGKDKEGVYRPEFVKEMYRDIDRAPEKTFKNAKAFLAEVRAAK